MAVGDGEEIVVGIVTAWGQGSTEVVSAHTTAVVSGSLVSGNCLFVIKAVMAIAIGVGVVGEVGVTVEGRSRTVGVGRGDGRGSRHLVTGGRHCEVDAEGSCCLARSRDASRWWWMGSRMGSRMEEERVQRS